MNPTLRNATTPLCEDRLEHLPSWLRYEHSSNGVDCLIAVCELNRQPGMVLFALSVHAWLSGALPRQAAYYADWRHSPSFFFLQVLHLKKPYFETLKVKL